jgi:hypothetical protein
MGWIVVCNMAIEFSNVANLDALSCTVHRCVWWVYLSGVWAIETTVAAPRSSLFD